MEMNIAEQKKLMRKEMRTKRDAFPFDEKVVYDQAICQKLETIVSKENTQTIHCYLPMGSEIDIKPFIQNIIDAGKTIVCPKTLKNRQLQHLKLKNLTEIEDGLWGTKHPKGNEIFAGRIDLVIVPGLAFDKNNYRLGYGGGYYDSFLSEHPEARKIGVCYPFQFATKVPRETHDAQLDDVLVARGN